MSKNKETALQQALAAILYVAKEQGSDISTICEKAKTGLFDSGNLYRYTSADYVVPASEAIDEALSFVNEQWKAKT